MAKLFTEATRVQIPAILHLMRLGYKYLPVVTEYDHKTNILTDVFKECVQKLNPGIAAQVPAYRHAAAAASHAAFLRRAD